MYNSIMGSVKSGHIQWSRDVYQIKQKRQSPHLHSSSQQRFVSQALSYMPWMHTLVKTGDSIIYHVNGNIRTSIENTLSGHDMCCEGKESGAAVLARETREP